MKKLIFLLFLLIFVPKISFAGTADVCEPCTTTADCLSGLTCVNGKCRGCPSTPGVIKICNPLQVCDFRELIDNLINFIFVLALGIAPLMVIIGGAYFLTSAGDPKKIDTAKKIIIYTLIGLVIVLFAKGIIVVLEDILGY
jgi:hypothetical protein